MNERPLFEPLEARLLLDAASVFYVTIPSQQSGGAFAGGGVYRTLDRGETWEWAMGAGINTEIGEHPWGESDIDQYWFLGQDESIPNTIYVTNRGTGYDPPYHYTVYYSEDAGVTWEDRFYNDPRYPENNTEVGWLFWAESRGWGGPASGFAVSSADADQLLYVNWGEVFQTVDAGAEWQQVYSHYVDGQPAPTLSNPGRWESIGLEDTSNWYYEFDPHDPNRTYICYTDIGFARSTDDGQTWYSSNNGIDWSNTIYDIAFDPDVPGRIYAACSNQHDIPHWSSVAGATGSGGIAVSSDYGVTWTSLHTGLPSAPVTSIVVDSTSPVGSRTLYATVYGSGVYKSTDGGASWTNRSAGITPTNNLQVYALKQLDDGTLLCTVAGRRPGNGVSSYVTGGLFRSTDAAQTWTNIGPAEMWRPVDFAVNPADPDIIYVAAMDGFGHYGGVYKTTNGGAGWTRLMPDYDPSIVSWVEGFGVFLNPQNPDIVYFTTVTHGMFISTDAGATWAETDATSSPPFRNVQRIRWDPDDPDTVYIATFGGGVWKGPDPAFASGSDTWTSVGPGGGGAFFYPAVSPHDSNLLFVSSDMSGMYRSDDGGVSWTMLDWRDIQQSRSPVFHPTDPDIVYACAWDGDVLKVSTDAGVTWSVVGGTTPAWDGDTLVTLSIDRGDPGLMLLSGENGLYRSTDGGATWAEVVGAPGGFLGMHFDQTTPAGSRVVLAANENAPYRSDDGGLTWVQKSNGLPWGGIRSFSGASESVEDSPLIAEYAFATDARDTADGHDGVLQGDAHVADGRLALDGRGDYVQVADSVGLEPATFTIALWLSETETSNRVVLEKDGNAGYSVQTGADGTVKMNVGGWSLGKEVKSNVSVNDGVWHHVVFEYAGSLTGRVYVDGVECTGTSQTKGGPLYGGGALYLGGRGGAFSLAGKLDEVKIYDSVLSEAEIAALYDAEKGMFESGPIPVAHYEFTTDATDSADGHDGTLNGDAHVSSGHLLLDGNGDYVQVADSAALEPATFTIALWLSETETSNRVVLEKDGNAGYSVQTSADGTVKMNVGGWSLGKEVKSSVSVNDGQWHHVVFRYEGSLTGRVYVDGVDCTGTGQTKGGPLYGAGSLYIGGRGGAFGLAGKLDEVKIYDSPLSEADITALYDAEKGAFTSL